MSEREKFERDILLPSYKVIIVRSQRKYRDD